MYAAGWRVTNPDVPRDSKASRDCARLSAAYYHHLLEFEQSIESERYLRCPYSELVRTPGATVRRIYDHFDYTWTGALEKTIGKAEREAAQFHSRHRYGLEEFGLTPEWISRELEPVYRAYSADLGKNGCWEQPDSTAAESGCSQLDSTIRGPPLLHASADFNLEPIRSARQPLTYWHSGSDPLPVRPSPRVVRESPRGSRSG